MKKNATPTMEFIQQKQKQVQNPFSTIRSHFRAMNLSATTDILVLLKDGRKGQRDQIKPYSKTALQRREGKIIKSSLSAQFKSDIGGIPITRTIKGEKKSRFTMQERLLYLPLIA